MWKSWTNHTNWLTYFIAWWNWGFYWTVSKLVWHLTFLLILNFLTLWRTVILCVYPKIAPKSTAKFNKCFFTILHIPFAFPRPISNQLLSRITVGQMWTLNSLVQNKRGHISFGGVAKRVINSDDQNFNQVNASLGLLVSP